MSMGRNFNFIVYCLNQFLLVRSGRIMSDWELGAQVTLFIDGEISGSGSLVSTPFHQINDGGGTRQMCMVKVQNVEPAFESAQPLGMGTSVKLSDCIGMQIPWPEIDIRRDAHEGGHSAEASNDTRRCYSVSALRETSDVGLQSVHRRDNGEPGSLRRHSSDDEWEYGDSSAHSTESDDSVSAESALQEAAPVDDGLRRFPPRETWKGEKCILTIEDGSVEAVGRIQACSPDDIWMNEALGQLHVGVLVLSTLRRSCADHRMSHRRWPLLSTRLEGGKNLATITNFHSEQPPAIDEEAYLGGVKKAPYTPMRRVLREDPKRPPKRVHKTEEDCVRAVALQSCCDLQCYECIPWAKVAQIQEKYWSKTFDERREFGVDLIGRFHKDGEGSPLITMFEEIVCEKACWKILGISKTTFFDYKRRYQVGLHRSIHGNTGIRKPRPHTVQAEGTVMTLVRDHADRPPVPMKGIGRGRKDVHLFFLPPLSWTVVREAANSVSDFTLIANPSWNCPLRVSKLSCWTSSAAWSS
jgi:hypothetical protein